MTVHLTECDGCSWREKGRLSSLGSWREITIPNDPQHRDVRQFTLCPDCLDRFEKVVLL